MQTRLLPDRQSLSLKQQIAQLMIVRASGHLFDSEIQYPQWEPPNATLNHWIQDLGVGGVILLGGSAAEVALRTQQLQTWADIPLLLTADVEEGVGQRFSGATWMPPIMALGTIAQTQIPLACDYARSMGQITAREARSIGLNWLLAPVVDVNNNPENPVINVRSFSDNPTIVSQLAVAYIQGANAQSVLTTAKHFPGHGDTTTDSHLTLPTVSHGIERLETIELMPFRAAIGAGVSAIMSAHLNVPAVDVHLPATLSPQVLTHLLRQSMAFEGLIVTDALVMQAITQHYGPYEAPILALEAGADLVLMPVDPPGAIEAIYQAVQHGRIAPEHIQASLERIWRAKGLACSQDYSRFHGNQAQENVSPPSAGKHPYTELVRKPLYKYNLASADIADILNTGERANTNSSHSSTPHNWENVSLASIHLEHLAQTDAIELTQNILQKSCSIPPFPLQHMTLSEGKDLTVTTPIEDSNFPHLLKANPAIPDSSENGSINLIVVDNLRTANFLDLHTPSVQIPKHLGYTLQWVDMHTPYLDPIAQPTLLQLFMRGNPFRGNAGLNTVAQTCLNRLLETENLQAFVLYGSPYAWEAFRSKLPPDVPAIFSYGQMPTAQTIVLKALFGDSIRENKESNLVQPFTT